MSASTDMERSIDWAYARTERLKAKARLLQLIIRADIDGITTSRALSAYVRQRRHEIALPPEVRPIGTGHVMMRKWLRFLEMESENHVAFLKRKRTREARP